MNSKTGVHIIQSPIRMESEIKTEQDKKVKLNVTEHIHTLGEQYSHHNKIVHTLKGIS